MTTFDIIPSQDVVSREAGDVDVQFRLSPQKATVVTLTKDALVDLARAIADFRESDEFGDYDEPDDFGMYTAQGDRAVDTLVKDLVAGLQQGTLTDPDEARAFLDTTMDRIAGKHSEVWDTDVRESIADEIAAPWKDHFGEEFSIYEF
jgi:hypothetical protein